MRKFLRYFTHLSTIQKFEFILVSPILIVLLCLNVLLLIGTKFSDYMLPRLKQVMTILLIVAVLAIPIIGCTHWEGTVPEFRGIGEHSAEMYVYHNCHWMANNFIIAEDGQVYGYVRADEKNINRILSVLAEYDLDNEDKLIAWLTEFKNKDYSNAVDFHNYCWNMLNGNTGYAVDLKNKYK